MSDFAKVMMIALVCLIGAVALFNFAGFSGSSGGLGDFKYAPAGTDFSSEEAVTTTSSSFFVGKDNTPNFVSKTLQAGKFEISYLTGLEQLASGSVDVREGFFYSGSSETYDFEMTDQEISSLSAPTITGEIIDTNLYGDLSFVFNGRGVYSERLSPGETFSILIDPAIFENQNELRVFSTSSSWRIWAPSVYRVRFSMASGFTGNSSKNYEFSVSSSQLPATNGTITAKVSSVQGKGNLIALVNGNQVYNSTATGSLMMDFNGTLLKSGRNVISLGSDGTSVYSLENLGVIHRFEVKSSNPTEREFSLSDSDLNRLPGKITFRIDRIVGSPSLTVDILDRTGFRSRELDIDTPTIKMYTINIDESEVSTGKNSATFRVSGTGGVQVSNFRVEA